MYVQTTLAGHAAAQAVYGDNLKHLLCPWDVDQYG